MADAPFGPFPLYYLDHGAAEADARTSKGRHTRVSFRLDDMITRLLAQTGLSREDIAGPGTGLISGSCYGCAQVFEMHMRLRKKGPRGVDPVSFAQATHNYPISAAAIEFGIEGPCLAAVSAGGAGLDALQIATDWLREGRCERVLVAAYEDFAPPIADHLAARAQTTPGKSYGEAMVLLLLERESVAAARGVHGAPELMSIVNQNTPEPKVGAKPQTPFAAQTFSPRTIDYLGAGGLLAVHDLLNSPDVGQRGSEHWQIAAPATAGSSVAVRIGIRQMEDCI
ncbi:beta-ketoacyl synthase N-terminal-like domain-containing protein [Pacificoceanicola onchidii]|uniref:beta-ketoacyl synthase N-terminal-like domain-containing protein n=1 Tax=Pacificoceanicola onchidii TaxID=2562685 RepID=UPI001455E2B9|nr:beta-ketoacyl synthase N-terminal-like domain-containing protein [Pacificoceanicola onchidii]